MLRGVTVVALEQAVSAPMCTRTLGDLGARVIKIENPRGGDFARHYDDVVKGSAAHFVWVNRGKESVALDVKSPAGREVLHRLLHRADVLVSNLAPGALSRLDLELPERLISVEIDGYGPGGPLSHKRAYDLLVQAESGACAVTGRPGAPAKPGPPMADVTSGLYAAISILAMLRDGTARTARISLFDTMTELMGYPLTFTGASGVDQEPAGMGSPAVAPYGAFATADGSTVVLGTTNDAEWQRLSRSVIQRTDLADDPRYATNAGRVAHRDDLHAAIGAWCSIRDLATVQTAADAAGIGNSRHNRPSEVIAHPHLVARDRWRSVDTPGGAVPALLPPFDFEGYEPPMGAVPSLGQHTEKVLLELGYDRDDIELLRLRGVIGGEQSA